MTRRKGNPAASAVAYFANPRSLRSPSVLSAIAALGVLLTLVLAGCGGGGSDSTGSGGGSGAESSSQGSEAATAKAELAKLYKGDYRPPEATGPAPKSGLNVWAVLPGFASATAKLDGEAFKEAAQELGWTATLKDGKFEPSVELAAVREAVRAHADAIWLETIECSVAKAGLEEAKKAGIVVVASGAEDCDPPLFTAETTFGTGGFRPWVAKWGEAQAVWAIAKTNAEAKVLIVGETDLSTTKAISQGVRGRIEKCESCEIVGEVGFVGTELGPPLQQKVEQALLQYPETTVIAGGYDAAVELGIAAAARASGKKLMVLGGEGQPNNIEMVRNGEQSMGVGYPFGWIGWDAVNAINRIEGGETSPGDSGIGIQVYDAEHNLPPNKGEAYVPPIEFRKYYRKAWGL